jgi:NADH-quinone oxidoreductase subunit C
MNTRVIDILNLRYPHAILSATEYRGETTLLVGRESIHELCTELSRSTDLSYTSLRDICGVDYYRPENRFEVIYNLYSINFRSRLRLKVQLDESDPHVRSVYDVWRAANWFERETYDMFGIIFDGHPDLRRMYMPEEFEHFPLRKDFPLMGIPGSLPLPRK